MKKIINKICNSSSLKCMLLLLILLMISGCKKDDCKDGNHSYSEWYVVENATCEKEGISQRDCKNCDYFQTKTIEATGHFGEWKEVYPTSYYSNGLERKNCENCNYFEERDIPQLDATPVVEEAIKAVSIPEQTLTNIILPTSSGEVTISWKTSDSDIINAQGQIGKRSAINQKVLLQGTYSLGNVTKAIIYEVTLLGYTNEEKLEIVMNSITFPQLIEDNIVFTTSFNYGIKAEYSSNNTDYLTNDGQINPQSTEVKVKLTVTLTLGSDTLDREFEITIAKYNEPNRSHLLIEYMKDLDITTQTDLEINNNRITLKEGVTEATFISKEIQTENFTSLVASWAAISSTTSTCELMVSVKVDNAWSDYITYGEWGLGLQNASYDQTNSLIKLSTDEVKVLNSKTANAIKYKVILRRTSTNYDSPSLSLVSFALEIPNYSYYVKTVDLPNYVCYNVPKLYQGAVPTIGNSICSPTSTTMLLKYKGLDFTDKDLEYEHRYIAGIVRDYGNSIYGNWVYNTATMGGYGFNAYVARMYSVDELRYYLANVGPVALTVKGTMSSSEKVYTTNGHLIVAIGYKYIDEELYIICNDPNVPNIYCEYSLTVINNTWRKVAYVIE